MVCCDKIKDFIGLNKKWNSSADSHENNVWSAGWEVCAKTAEAKVDGSKLKLYAIGLAETVWYSDCYEIFRMIVTLEPIWHNQHLSTTYGNDIFLWQSLNLVFPFSNHLTLSHFN